MLTVYLKRNNGDLFHVPWRHVGQHLSVQGEKARRAQLYWAMTEVRPEVQGALEALLITVPLLDSVILTRGNPQIGEEVRQVFSGLVVECGMDGQTMTVMAQDDPEQKKLQDKLFGASVPAQQGVPSSPGAWFRVPPGNIRPAGRPGGQVVATTGGRAAAAFPSAQVAPQQEQ